MTYAKDIILDLNYKSKQNIKRRVNLLFNKIKSFSTRIKQIIKNNKFLTVTLVMLGIFILADIILINGFFSILENGMIL